MQYLDQIRDISRVAFRDEKNLVEETLEKANFFRDRSDDIFERAYKMVELVRNEKDHFGIENFLKEYSLSSYEGVAVLCLAEALLRIPDSETADDLIEDKLEKGNWKKYIHDKAGLLINSSSWGLLIGSRALDKKGKNRLEKAAKKVISEISEPIVRIAIKKAMGFLGSTFVLGRTIEEALKKSEKLNKKSGYLFSFDMLGEEARTKKQANSYFDSYMNCIKKAGEKSGLDNNKSEVGIYSRPNVSIKLSALHPRYELKKIETLKKELLPKILELCEVARKENVWVSIDAEESYRLDLSLLIIAELFKDKEIAKWGGLGFVLQAYGKRALKVLELLKEISNNYNDIKIPVRLVKGAYWDAEIKYAQEHGLKSYPVFTKKSHTDLNYLVGANYMLENIDNFYPQFASHSAATVASIFVAVEEKSIKDNQYEMQKLYGMGNAIYEEIVAERPVRIYAPVGSYKDLLPYLIRRILENGANSSFVSKVADENEPIEEILTSPIEKIISQSYTSKHIELPEDIYAPDRINSKGYDIGNLIHFEKLENAISNDNKFHIKAKSIIGGEEKSEIAATDIEEVIQNAEKYNEEFNLKKHPEIVKSLEKLSSLIEENESEFISLLTFEAKKTIDDSIAEIRETVDFLRYYSAESLKLFKTPDRQKGYTGEASTLNYRPKGTFLCISPWNFPLAIFTGQIAAALATGNSVIAKPAEQTTQIAYFLCNLAIEAGIDKNQLQLVIGKGSVLGKALTEKEEINGIAFTGSTNTAKLINRTLAEKHKAIKTLIAETGGQNCFMVDSSALLERACDDVINCSFGSAGQRCSAARVVYVQEEIADEFIEMLQGAVDELKISDSSDIATDLSAVIDETAKDNLQKHIDKMKGTEKAKLVAEGEVSAKNQDDSFIKPTIFEIEDISILEEENFGPIMHILKFKREKTDEVIKEINSTGFGLTFGIHSRVNDYVEHVTSKIKAGNIYINRGSTGAIVETHPFGGMNLSGTGFKAGGPNYLKRFVNEVTIIDNISAIGGNIELIV